MNEKTNEKQLRREIRWVQIGRVVDLIMAIMFVLYALILLTMLVIDLCCLLPDDKVVDESTATIVEEPKEELPVVDTPIETVTPEPIVTEVRAVELEPSTAAGAIEMVYYDVPLDEDLQKHIIIVCNYYNIEPSIIFAMIERESRFRADVIGDNGRSYGLMQIQPRWHQARMDKLGVTDLLDPYQNVLVGIDYIAELFTWNQDVEWVLMAYNGGPSYANRLAGNGTVSAYATGVLDAAREMRGDAA
jgi:hypothetical protein